MESIRLELEANATSEGAVDWDKDEVPILAINRDATLG